MSNKTDYLVIGAGLPRTGTTSLHRALEQILGPTYNMDTMFNSKDNNSDIKFWNKVLKRQATKDDWKGFVRDRGLSASVDFPSSFYWREQVKMFPEAKVILTVRSPESWCRSVKRTVVSSNKEDQEFPNSWYLWLKGMTSRCKIGNDVSWAIPEGFSTSFLGVFDVGRKEEEALEFFNQWTETVKGTVPKERLLIFEAKDGWEPLCKFLDLPIPSNPYPRLNDSKTLNSEVAKFKRTVYTIVFGIPALVAAGIAYYLINSDICNSDPGIRTPPL